MFGLCVALLDIMHGILHYLLFLPFKFLFLLLLENLLQIGPFSLVRSCLVAYLALC